MELYPVKTPFPAKHFEDTLRSQRTLYNVALVASGDIQVQSLTDDQVDQVIDNDEGIPPNLILQISCIDSGSIWVSLKSGSQSALKYLGSLFETGASAKLAEQLANAKQADIDAQISEATRNAVAEQILTEQEKLKAENIRATYETWRDELRSRLAFLDELIDKATDRKLTTRLRKRKNEAILQMADQQMVPIVRNVPGSFMSYDNGVPRLPPPSS